jgi:hypothetical protein
MHTSLELVGVFSGYVGCRKIYPTSQWAAVYELLVLHLAGKLSPSVDFQFVRESIFQGLERGFRKLPQ